MVIVAILFGRNSQNIYSGQVVTGKVHVETTERIRTRGIRIELSGQASVRWTEHDRHTDSNGQAHTTTRTYSGNETYMDLVLHLSRLENHSSEITLEPGVHTFPFSFTVPSTLPSSFQGEHGSITYKMKAIVDRIMRFDDKAEIGITIVRLLDLNYEPQFLKGPLVNAVQHLQTSGCYGCCCISGIPQISLTLNRGCFVPGETMIVGGQVENRTNTKIDNIVVEFIQRQEFWGSYFGEVNCRSKSVTKVLASAMTPAVKSGRTQTWDSIVFHIPPVVASRLDGCSIIHIMYYIQLTVNFASCCSSGTANQEIIIGNIPLHTSTITSQPPGYELCYPGTESNAALRPPVNCGDGGMSNSGFDFRTGDKAPLVHHT